MPLLFGLAVGFPLFARIAEPFEQIRNDHGRTGLILLLPPPAALVLALLSVFDIHSSVCERTVHALWSGPGGAASLVYMDHGV
jgi:hypothetical protein